MTPKQLAELEVWLAAGFDLPTALAAVGADEGDSEETATDDTAQSSLRPASEEPAIWHYLVAFAVAIVSLLAVLRFFGG